MFSVSRITLALVAVCILTLGSVRALASTISTSGTWTYIFTLGPGVTFTTANQGAIGSTNGSTISFAYIGAPAGYQAVDGFVGSGNTDSNGIFDVEIALQYRLVADSTQLLDYTFIEPISFWSTPGASTFPNDGNTVFDVTYWVFDPNFDPFFGTLNEGANFATNVDPPCTSCSITILAPAAVVTPEPSSLVLLATGSAGAWFTRRRRWL